MTADPLAKAAPLGRMATDHHGACRRAERVLDQRLIIETVQDLEFGTDPVVPVMSMSPIAAKPAIVSLSLDLVAGGKHHDCPAVLCLSPNPYPGVLSRQAARYLNHDHAGVPGQHCNHGFH